MNKEQLKSKYKDEMVLCVPTNELEKYLENMEQDNVANLVDAVADCGLYEYRYNAELDFDLRQVIPYVVLQCGDEYFVTERIQGDERLIGKMSIAVGGHINPCDTPEYDKLLSVDGVQDSIINCIMRELDEETTVDLSKGFSAEYCTTFVDDREEVSKVHVCLLTFVKLTNKEVEVKETEKLKGHWMKLDEIEQHMEQLEGWSEIALNIIKEM